MNRRSTFLRRAAWVITALGLVPALLVWLMGMDGQFWTASRYELFPLLGLVAFTLMWSHYLVGALRLHLGVDKSAIKQYWSVTSWVVLVAIVLHPGILILSLWRDGFGLPPGSYTGYVAPQLMWAVALGTVSLLIFLAYELHRWFGAKSWWAYVQRASDLAMVLILMHGFRLGGDLATGWFKIIWLIYAETYLIALIYTYYHLIKRGPRSMVG